MECEGQPPEHVIFNRINRRAELLNYRRYCGVVYEGAGSGREVVGVEINIADTACGQWCFRQILMTSNVNSFTHVLWATAKPQCRPTCGLHSPRFQVSQDFGGPLCSHCP